MNGCQVKSALTSLLGAVAGAVLGYLAVRWIARQGFYALILPGALVGLGGGLLAKDRCMLRGILCGLLALAVGFFTDWKVEPFIRDTSLSYYLSHINLLRPITLLMIAAGGLFGFWLALGKEQPGAGRRGTGAAGGTGSEDSMSESRKP